MTRLGLPQLPRLDAPRLGQIPRAELTPEEEQTLVGRLGGTALGGISAVGNILDLVGSSARDVLAGENPFDQWLTPASPENRTTGRQLLRQYGLVGKRDTWQNFGAGVLAEIALDPLSIASFGASALSKAGHVARRAGILEEAAKAASKATGGSVKVGPRLARRSLSLDELIADSANPLARENAEKAAAAMGTTLEALGKQKLGGDIGISMVPFGRSQFTVPVPFGEQIAKGLDIAGEAVRYGKYSPIRPLVGMFGRGMRGATSASVQKVLPDIENAAKGELAAIRTRLFDVLDRPEVQSYFDIDSIQRANNVDAKEANRLLNQNGNAALDYLEGVTDTFDGPEELLESLDRGKALVSEVLNLEQAAGLKTTELDDIWVDYWPQLRTRFPGEGSVFNRGGAVRLQHGFQQQRLDFLKHIKGGRSVVQRMSVDPEISGFAHTKSRGVGRDAEEAISQAVQDMNKPFPGGAPKLEKEELDALVDVVRRKYGDDLHLEADFNPSGISDTQLRAVTQWVANLDPRHADLEIPAFQQNPFASLEARLDAGARAAATSKGFSRMLADSSVAVTKDQLDGRGINAEELLARMHGGAPTDEARQLFLNDLADAGNPALQRAELDDAENVLENIWIPEKVADDVTKIMQGHLNPKATNPLFETYDKFLQHWKASVTVWPAFHSRNLTSGQAQNILADAWDARSFGQAWRLIQGDEAIRGLGDSAPVFKGMDDTQATKEFRRLLFAHDVLDARHGSHAIDNVGPSVSRPAGKVKVFTPPPAGTNVKARINPLATETFEPFRVSRNLGTLVESWNRATPFLNLLKKGTDAAEAAKRTLAIQVDYKATAAADPFMRRLFPFWSFSRGVAPFVVSELMERPGGRMGRTIMGINRSRDPSELTPDFVAESSSIPLGSLPDGTERYITGTGLMTEDILSFISTDKPVQTVLLEALSRTNPLIKSIGEVATGQSFFQRGPLGGRPLEELDPTIGRTIANIRQQFGAEPIDRAQPFISRGFEFIAANSPVGRLLTSARTATDPRKGLISSAFNLGTGVRVTDVSPAQQDFILKQRAQESLKQFGARTLTKTYVPTETILGLPPEEQAEALRYNALIRRVDQRNKERKLAIN